MDAAKVEEKEKLTPHTLRLIQLITNTSNKNNDKEVIETAIGLLTRIAKSTQHTSYYQLWDILGRLQRSILSPDNNNDRKNNKNNQLAASQAMKCIFACLPLHSENNNSDNDFFISHDNDKHYSDESSHNCSNNSSSNWLQVQDLLKPRNMLDTILQQGYVLLSHENNHDNYDEDTDYALHEFDYKLKQQQQQPKDSNHNNDETKDYEKDYENFCQRRIELQRTILAKRLGLWIPPTSIEEIKKKDNNNHFSFLTAQDFQYLQPSSSKKSTTSRKRKQQQKSQSYSKAQPHKKKQKKNNKKNNDKDDDDDDDDDDEKRSDLEVILLWQVQRQQKQDKNGCNNNSIEPQMLLATEFLYRMLDPNWHIRYGAFLGLLALLQAWWQTNNNRNNYKASDCHDNHYHQCKFGVWLHDLLTRCLIVLSLDQFGDYSGALVIPNTSSKNNQNHHFNVSMTASTTTLILGSSVMAPVQEIAAQVVALLYNMAPPSIQTQCWNVLKTMLSYNNNNSHCSSSSNQKTNTCDDSWHLRHGALLAFKYIAALLLSSSSNNNTNGSNYQNKASRFKKEKLQSIGTIAISALQDSSYDVVATAAQILNTLLPLDLRPMTTAKSKNDNKMTTIIHNDSNGHYKEVFTKKNKSFNSNKVKRETTEKIVDSIKNNAWKPILKVLKTLDPCYPCCVDILSTLSILLQLQQNEDEYSSYIHDEWSWLLDKLLQFLTNHQNVTSSVQISSLQALTCVIPSILKNYNIFQKTNNDNNLLLPTPQSTFSDNIMSSSRTINDCNNILVRKDKKKNQEIFFLYNTMSSLIQHLFEFYWDDRNFDSTNGIQNLISNLGYDNIINNSSGASSYNGNLGSPTHTPTNESQSLIFSSYQRVRNQAWNTMVEALSDLIIHPLTRNTVQERRDESLILYDAILTLLLRLVNIKIIPTRQEIINDATTSSTNTVSTAFWTGTKDEDAIYKYYYGLLEEKLPKQYSQTLLASNAFAQMLLLSCRTNTSTRVILSFVSVAIQCMLQSPWPTICETGCLILHSLMIQKQKSTLLSNSPLLIHLWKKILIEGCQSILESAIFQSPKCFQSTNSQSPHQKNGDLSSMIKSSNDEFFNILKCCMRETLCTDDSYDHIIAINEKLQQNIKQILYLWKGNQKKYQPTTPTMSSMRLSASLATAMISLGYLPSTKLTPLIRALMTSLKNETCPIRSQTTYQSIVKLLKMLHFRPCTDDINQMNEKEETKQQAHQFLRGTRIREKILENICAMGCVTVGHSNFNNNRGYTMLGCKGSQEIIKLIIQDLTSQLPSSLSIIDITPFWKRLQPLIGLDPAASGEENLLQSLVLFSIVSSSLFQSSSSSISSSQQTTNNLLAVLIRLLPTTTLVACASTLALTRHKAVFSITNICKVDPIQAVPNVLPTLFKYLHNIENDSGRLGGCSLLNSLVDGLGINICPFVRFILPVAMSMMTDTVKDCAMISASSFASLVRVAPLVQIEDNDDKNEIVVAQWDKQTQKRMREECQIEASDKVINHLIHGKPLPFCILPHDVDNALKAAGVVLRDYQKEGISWIHFLQTVRLSGALCDDMGLGKTLQSLVGVAIAHSQLCSSAVAKKEGKIEYFKEKSLVVCPSTLVLHWVNEIKKFFPTTNMNPHSCLKVMAYDGSKKQRNLKWKENFDSCNIIVTSYPILRNDISHLKKTMWVYCILDEGHLLKNPKTATAKAARLLRSQHKMILTGTPVQNKVNELWAVFDFLMPNYLGSENDFAHSYAKVIEKGQLPGASSESVRKSTNKLKLLHQQVLPFILRREKGQIMKELPPKTIIDLPCVMSEQQLDLYSRFCSGEEGRRALKLLQNILDSSRNNLESCDRIEKQNTIPSFSQKQDVLGRGVLRSLFYLRLLCTHPILVASSGNKNKITNSSLVNATSKIKVEHQDYGSLMELKDDGSSNDNNVLLLSSLECSGKLLVLNDLMRSAGIFHDEITAADNDESLLYINDYGKQEISTNIDYSMSYYSSEVEENDNDNILGWMDPENIHKNQNSSSGFVGNKCLIFAQFTQSLDVVEEFLFRPHMPSLQYLRLDGRVPTESRAEIVKKFNEDNNVKCLLLTTKVGGLGLNLTGADTVIFLEHDWNPYADIQAMDRAHRIGQTKAVNVYRLVTSNSIEEKIMELHKIKIEMANAIVNSENSTIYSMGTDRLLDLFTFEDTNKLDETNEDKGDKILAKKNGNLLTSEIDDLWCEEEYSKLSVSEFLNGLVTPTQDFYSK